MVIQVSHQPHDSSPELSMASVDFPTETIRLYVQKIKTNIFAIIVMVM